MKAVVYSATQWRTRRRRRKEPRSSGKQGVYLGESARSIFERAKEHQEDKVGRKDDSI